MNRNETTVCIDGREFRFGAWYEPRLPRSATKPKKLLRWHSRRHVLVATGPTERSYVLFAPEVWAEWAGVEIPGT